jgi:hypothetical protein
LSVPVVLDVDVDVLRGLAATQPLGGLLNPEFLGVDELGLVEVDAEGSLSLTALALVGFLEVAVGLWDARQRPAPLALEGGVGDLGTDVGRLADDPLDCNEPPVVVVTDLADARLFGEVLDPDVGLSQRDVDGQVVQPQRLLGVLDELLWLASNVVGQVGIEAVEISPVDVE